MKQAINLLAGIFLSLQAFAQFNIRGRITDDSGKTLTGANIIIENTYYGTISDKQGNYSLKKVTKGEKSLIVSYIGYETEQKTVNINEDIVLNFSMKHSSILGEEVLIKGIRAGGKDPVASTNISKEEIDKRNLGQDIPFLLSYTPSIVTTSDAGAGVGYTGFRIRGTDGNRINVTVNGIPLNDAESHGVWFVDMPDMASSIDNIQIQRGVGTSTNGAAAFGASINFQTLTLNKKPYSELNNSYGSFNTYKNSVGFGTGLLYNKFTFDMRLSNIHSDGYIDRARSDLRSWFLSGSWYSDKSLVKLNIFSGKEETYQAWDGVPGYLLDSLHTYNGIGRYTDENGNIRYYNNETDNYNQTHYQLHYSHQVNSDINFTGALHFTRGLGYYEQYKEDQDLVDYGIPEIILNSDTITTSDIIRRKWLDNYFYGSVLSMNINKGNFDINIGGAFSIYEGNHYGTVIWARNAGITEKDHKWYESKGEKIDYNAFAKINYSLSNSFNLYADLQSRGINYNIKGFDDDNRNITQDHSYLFFNPKFGINYKINNFQSFFSFAVAGREPNRDNFVDASLTLGTPMPETLYDYELGYNFNYNVIKLGMNLYYMDYNNQLVLTGEINDVGSPIMRNVKDSYRAGVELTFGSNISKKISWDFNMNLSSNKIKNFNTYVDNWDYWNDPVNEEIQKQFYLGSTDIAFSPEIVAGNSIKINPFKGFDFIFQSKYVGKQYIDNTGSSDRMLNSWFVNDVRISYVKKTQKFGILTFNVLIANIFNEKYESNAWVYRYISNGKESKSDGFYPQAGINFLAGIKVRF